MTAFRLEPVAVFMVGVVLALQLNYPDLRMQRERIDAHAQAALLMAGILFAAGAFTGIMKESGMLDAMAKSAVALVAAGAGRHLPLRWGCFHAAEHPVRPGFILFRRAAGAGGNGG